MSPQTPEIPEPPATPADPTRGSFPDPRPLAALALGRTGSLHGARLVCVDGPAGSGKSTLARLLARALQETGARTTLVHVDDLLEGWGGLPRLGARLESLVVRPLQRGEPATYHRYDWVRDAPAEPHTIAPALDVLLLEGVGSADPRYEDLVDLSIWVEAPLGVRTTRGLLRDGPHLEDRWRRWQVEEQALHAAQRTRDRADVLVDGVTGAWTPA